MAFQVIPKETILVADKAGWPVLRSAADDHGPNLFTVNVENFASPELAWGFARMLQEGLIPLRWKSTEDLELDGVAAMRQAHRGGWL